MCHDPIDRRARRLTQLVRSSIILAVVGFVTMLSALALPVSKNIEISIVATGLLVLLVAFIVLIAAILVRDIPRWKQNRWRFSTSHLFTGMFAISVGIGGITAAVREVTILQLSIGLAIMFVGSVAVTTVYCNWARTQYFKAMHAHGRYAIWNEVAARLSAGEGTAIVAPCHKISTVWWTPREVTTSDDAQLAINADAVVTPCPKTSRVARWLLKNFPTATIAVVAAENFQLESPG